MRQLYFPVTLTECQSRLCKGATHRSFVITIHTHDINFVCDYLVNNVRCGLYYGEYSQLRNMDGITRQRGVWGGGLAAAIGLPTYIPPRPPPRHLITVIA